MTNTQEVTLRVNLDEGRNHGFAVASVEDADHLVNIVLHMFEYGTFLTDPEIAVPPHRIHSIEIAT